MTSGRCFHEHLDIFTEVEKPDTQPLIETPFGGRLLIIIFRWSFFSMQVLDHLAMKFFSIIKFSSPTRFCGQNAPRERISLYQSLSMVFLSDRWQLHKLNDETLSTLQSSIEQTRNKSKSNLLNGANLLSLIPWTYIWQQSILFRDRIKLDFFSILNSFDNCRSNITSERFLGHYRFIPDSEL